MRSIPYRKGQVWQVPDHLLRLHPQAKRTEVHPTRPFLILSGDESNEDAAYPLVLGCPLSSQQDLKTYFCVRVGQGDGNLSKKSWVRVPLIQAFEKEHLDTMLGNLSAERLAEVEVSLFQYMGLA